MAMQAAWPNPPSPLPPSGEAFLFRGRGPNQPIAIRLALPPAAAVLIEVETSSSSQFRQ